jgi:hypothetical protein
MDTAVWYIRERFRAVAAVEFWDQKREDATVVLENQ